MIPASAEFKAALLSSHRASVRVTVWRRIGAAIAREEVCEIPTESGNLTVDSSGTYWRTADLSVPDAVLDSTGTRVRDVLNARDTDLRIEFGVMLPDGSMEWVRAATLRVDKVDASRASGVLRVTATDEGSRLARHPITIPWPCSTDLGTATDPNGWNPPRAMLATVAHFITQSYEDHDVGEFNWSDELLNRADWQWRDGLVWQGDRWQQIKMLADALGAWFYNDPDGTWSGARLPAVESDPVALFLSGEYETLVDSTGAEDRDETFNRVYVRYEHPADGSATVAAEQVTGDLAVDGPYGIQVYEETNDVVSTPEDAQTAAADLLTQFTGFQTKLELSTVWNPLMIPGDHIQTERPDGTVVDHIVIRVNLPWPVGRMTLTTRQSGDEGAPS